MTHLRNLGWSYPTPQLTAVRREAVYHRLSWNVAARLKQYRDGVVQLARASTKTEETSRRPSLNDVESLSKGNAARQRGTGSRQVPHRLNTEERKLYDLAKDKVVHLIIQPQKAATVGL